MQLINDLKGLKNSPVNRHILHHIACHLGDVVYMFHQIKRQSWCHAHETQYPA